MILRKTRKTLIIILLMLLLFIVFSVFSIGIIFLVSSNLPNKTVLHKPEAQVNQPITFTAQLKESSIGYRFLTINKANGLPSNYINCIISYKDSIWVGTENGVTHSKDRGQTWERPLSNSDLPVSPVIGLWVDDGVLWIGFENRLFFSEDEVTWKEKKLPDDYSPMLVYKNVVYANYMYYNNPKYGPGFGFGNQVSDIRQNSGWSGWNFQIPYEINRFDGIKVIYPQNNFIWMSTFTEGTGGRFAQPLMLKELDNPIPDVINTPNEGLISAIWGNGDTIWIGGRLSAGEFSTAKTLSVSFDQGLNWKNFGLENGLLSSQVLAIGGNSNSVWVATTRGLNVSYDQGLNWQSYRVEQGLIDAEITLIYGDIKDDIWIGTKNGLLRAIPYEVKEFNTILSGKYNLVYSDNSGLWIGSDNGISFTNDKGKTWKNYTSEHGIPPGTINSIWSDSKGKVYVASEKGLGLSQNFGNSWKFVSNVTISRDKTDPDEIIGVYGFEDTIYVVTHVTRGAAIAWGLVDINSSEDFGASWSGVYSDMYVRNVPKNPFKSLISGENLYVDWAYWDTGGVRISQDRGKTWEVIDKRIDDTVDTEIGTSAWIEGTRVWFIGKEVAYSDDNGSSWIKLDSWKTDNSRVIGIRTNKNVIWVLTRSALYLSKDFGKSWNTVASLTYFGEFDGDFAFDGINLWLLIRNQEINGILKTSDFGETWEDVVSEKANQGYETIIDIKDFRESQLYIRYEPSGIKWQPIYESPNQLSNPIGVKEAFDDESKWNDILFSDIGIFPDRVYSVQWFGNRLWIATNLGILRSDENKNGWELLQTSDGLSSNMVTYLTVWNDSLISFGPDGISRLDISRYKNNRPLDWQKFYAYQQSDLLYPEPIRAVIVDNNYIVVKGYSALSILNYSPPAINFDKETSEKCGSRINPGATNIGWKIDAPNISDPASLGVRYKISAPNSIKDEDWNFLLNTNPLRSGDVTVDTSVPGYYEIALSAGDKTYSWSDPILCQLQVVAPPNPWLFVIPTILAGVLSFWIGLFYFRQQQRQVGYNPFKVGLPITDQKHFFGREELTDQIIDSLNGNNIFLHGERRTGKSSLLIRLYTRLQVAIDTKYKYIPVVFNLQDYTIQNQLFYDIVSAIANELNTSYSMNSCFNSEPQDPASYSHLSFRKDVKKMAMDLQEKYQREPLITILVDEADNLIQYSPQTLSQLRGVIGSEEGQSLRFILAGTQFVGSDSVYGSPLHNVFLSINIPPLKIDEVEKLITNSSSGIYTFEKSAVLEIWNLTKGWPYQVQIAGLAAIERFGNNRNGIIKGADILQIKDEILQRIAGTTK